MIFVDKWNLSTLYKDESCWYTDIDISKKMIKDISSTKGLLCTEEGFVKMAKIQISITLVLYKIYLYAHLKSDQNKKNIDNAKLKQTSDLLINSYIQETSWIIPEQIKIGKEKILKFIDNNKIIEQYRFPTISLFHTKAHTLNEKSEWLIANFQSITSGDELYSSLAVSDNIDNDVILSNGKKRKITAGTYRSMLSDLKNQNDRKIVFEAIFKKYEKNKNTYASIYSNVLKKDFAIAKARNYKSSIDSFLFQDDIPISVYKSLIDVAKDNSYIVKKYINLRKKHLNIDDYHTYDRFVPLSFSDKKYSYNEAKNIFFESIKHLPEEFKKNQYKALEDGYVDIYERDGKRTGAYSSSVYPIHPFILLNFDKTLNSVFTLAHEAGHSAHSIFANEAQKLMTSDYKIFVAEIASTFNEHILLDYLVKKTDSKSEKIALLEKAIEDILSTFYRQTLFANYELLAHELVEKERPITEETLSNIMISLYDSYYGINIKNEKYKQYIWAYIPHFFYSPFYVYQYATCFSASLKIYSDVKRNKPKAIDNYLNLLKAGNSDFPIDLIKKAGIDLTSKSSFIAVINRLKELIDLLEIELNKK